MAISFSGLGSGMDYSSWVDALVAVKKESLTSVQSKISTVETSQKKLNSLKSSFTSLNSTISTFTDSNIISAFDIFSRKAAEVSDEKTASAFINGLNDFKEFLSKLEKVANVVFPKKKKVTGNKLHF